jgi:hypothetical protein
MAKPGSPEDTCTSTVTGFPSTPEMVAEAMVANTGAPLPVAEDG